MEQDMNRRRSVVYTTGMGWGWRAAVVTLLALGGRTGVGRAQTLYPAVWGVNAQNGMPAGVTCVAIATSGNHSLALKNDGIVVAWGANTYGQTSVPAGLSGVVSIAAGGSHSLALKSDGTVVAWGANTYGQTSVPAGLSGVVSIAAGESHSLALKSNGTVVAWGFNQYGQASVPTGLAAVVAIAGGGQHSLALKSDGTVVAWGWNHYGQSSPPPGLAGVVAVAGGGSHSLALRSDGTVVGWGWNDYGQSNPPPGLTGVVAIAGGGEHSLALKSDGIVVAWGANGYGQASVPAGLNGAAAIAAGFDASFALLLHPAVPIVTIASEPGGRAFEVFGAGCQPGAYTAGQTFQWTPGSSCTISFPSPQGGAQQGTRYVFSVWSDDPRAASSRTVVAPVAAAHYRVIFFAQNLLAMAASPSVGGTVSGCGWYNSPTTVTVSATPAPGYRFTGFSGDLTGLTNPQIFTMYRPFSATANFALVTSTTVDAVSGEYSDPIKLSATIMPAGMSAGLAVSGSLQFAVNGVNAGAPLAVNSSRTSSTNYVVTRAAAVFTGSTVGILGSRGASDLTVTKESAMVTPSAINPLAVQVNALGGNASSITLSATIQEEADGSFGIYFQRHADYRDSQSGSGGDTDCLPCHHQAGERITHGHGHLCRRARGRVRGGKTLLD